MPAKTIEPELRYHTQGAMLVGFTMKERVKMLLGYHVLIPIIIHSQHKPGELRTQCLVHLTKHTELDPAKKEYSEWLDARREREARA